MTCQHEGHDADTSHEVECAGCGEVTPAPDQHRCAPIGWAMHCDATDLELQALIRKDTP